MTALLAVEAIEAGKADKKDPVTASDTCWYDVTEGSSNENIQPAKS
jgi:D-alanyl-D-alanine carboxypeptidase